MKRKNLFALLLAMVLAVTCFTPFTVVVEAAEGAATVTIYHTNDSHGRMVGGNGIIGIDRIASVKAETPDALLVDVGDTFHGLPFVTINKGKDAVELMNLAKYDVFTPGNHDFNYGYETLLDLAKNADFDVLSSNVKKDGQLLFDATVVKEVGGVKIGFFGVSTPETLYKTNPLNVQGVNFDDIVACSEEAVAELLKQDVDVVVALTHLGNDKASVDTSAKLAESVDGIDVIIDGHDHVLYDNNYEVNGVLITSSKEYEGYVGKVTLTFDEDGNLSDRESTVIDCETVTANYDPEPAVEKEMEEIKAIQDEILNEEIGEIGYSLSAERAPGVRTQEMPLGNLAADALRAGTGADIAVTNGGGLRADLEEGVITRGDVVAILPFGNYGVTKNITPVKLKEFLENGVSSAPEPEGKFPQISGFKFTYNVEMPAGSRVTSIVIDGEAIDLTDNTTQYVFATNDFMAAGGDGYTMMADIKTENEFGALDEMLLEYIRTNEKVYSEAEGRVVAVSETVAPVEEPVAEEEEAVTEEPVAEVEEPAEPVEEPVAPIEEPAAVAGPVEQPSYNEGYAEVVNCYVVNVRAGTGTNFRVITYLNAGDVAQVLDTKNGWVQVSADDKEGWVYSEYLEMN